MPGECLDQQVSHPIGFFVFGLWLSFVACLRFGSVRPLFQGLRTNILILSWIPQLGTLHGIPDFTLGLFNPGGISNKLHMLDYMPTGWWHVAETQASKYQQCAFQGYLRSLSYRSGRSLGSSLGAPASLRPGSSYAGTWTGVLTFGDCPLRAVPCVWPHGEFDCGRVLLTTAKHPRTWSVCSHCLLATQGSNISKCRHLGRITSWTHHSWVGPWKGRAQSHFGRHELPGWGAPQHGHLEGQRLDWTSGPHVAFAWHWAKKHVQECYQTWSDMAFAWIGCFGG